MTQPTPNRRVRCICKPTVASENCLRHGAEVREAIADAEYWRNVAALVGAQLSGFTGRGVATFLHRGRGYEIHGWLAEEILSLSRGGKR